MLDSDEEDESQRSEKCAIVGAEECLQVSNNLDKRAGDQQGNRRSANGYNVHKGLAEGKEEEEGGESMQHCEAEKGLPRVITTADEDSNDIWPDMKTQELICNRGASRGLGDIDELQEDHYQDKSATQLDVELNHSLDLRIEKPNQKTASQPVLETLRSTSSSPLTELLPSSGRALPVEAQWISPLRGRSNPADIESSAQNREPFMNVGRVLNQAPHLSHDVVAQNLGRRNLRHRNPIQLHPYAIESEKYRQILKARGVKPLRIAQMESHLENATRQDTQEQDFDAEEDSQLIDLDVDSQDIVTSSPPLGHNAGLLPAQDLSDIFQFEGEEFPDMDSLLRQPIPHVMIQGNKRRKITHTFLKKDERRAIQPDAGLAPHPGMNLADDSFIFDAPPSPPRSGSSTPTPNTRTPKKVFRVPRGLSLVALPTPITSSEPRKHGLVEPFDDRDIDDGSGLMFTNEDSSEHSEPQSSWSENEDNSQIKGVELKIKSVLPASWLKLDLKAKAMEPGNTARIYSSTSPAISDQRGVARPITRLGRASLDTPASQRFPIDISNDEEPDLELAEPENATNLEQNTAPISRFDTRDSFDDQHLSTANWGEVEEDNRVDAMLPGSKRLVVYPTKRRTKAPSSKSSVPRQPRIAANKPHETSQRKPARQPRITDSFDKNRRKKPKFRPPALSILDAPTRDQLLPGAIPQFLKVASRTARSRNDQGRHSPSRKFLRLATADDTNDANETLRRWREGTLARVPTIFNRAHTKALNRQPLYPRSHNPRLPQMEDLHSPNRERPIRYISSSTKPRILQSSLYNKVKRGSLPQSQLSHNRQRMKPTKMKLNLRKHGNVLSSLHTSRDSRPALLESLQTAQDQVHRGSAFKRDLTRIDQTQDQAGASNILLAKLFDENAKPPSDAMGMGPDPREIHGLSRIRASAVRPPPRRRKKHRPYHIDIEALDIRQNNILLRADDESDHSISVLAKDPQQQMLIGLGSFGPLYTDDFNVKPLANGTCFHESTFIGSGEFLKSLNMVRSSDQDRPRGFVSLTFAQKTFRCGPWNDEVSGQLGQAFDTLCQALRFAPVQDLEVSDLASCAQIISFQRNIIHYFSDHLSFLDPVDRNSYLLRWKDLVMMVFSGISECVPANEPSESSSHDRRNEDFRIQLHTLLLVIANQLRQVSKHELVPHALQEEINSLVLTAARRNLTQALKEGFRAIRQLLDNLKHHETPMFSIKEYHHPIEALVITQHVIRQSTGSMAAFWETVNEQVLVQNLGKAVDVRVFEDQWRKLYTLLPFLEFDAQGILEPRQRFSVSHDNWTPVKRMINQVVEVYMSNARAQAPSFNAYVRALFNRCLHLINGWGWQRCESIIGTLFDFFARNNLAHLRNEESRGSPPFLEHLDQEPSLEISSHDRCFHILLKIIGSGLKCMRQIYSEKKIRDVVWRLMPNHGRSHPKEDAIRQEDLDALRNHHDLLCTLYWAAPPGFRPRLSVIRNLVHLESSHREACHISIRAWSNLVRFQLSTDEPASSVEPFAEWHDDLLGQIIRQHSLARIEAEEQVRLAQHPVGLAISKDVLESTIARNQRQVEAILSDALTSLKRVVDRTRTAEAARALLTPTLTKVFLLFDSRRSQVSRNIVEALDVLISFVGYDSKPLNDSNDDSQDYGDWSGFNDGIQPSDDMGSSRHGMATRLQEIFHESLRNLLSNAFGADTLPNDGLLIKLVEAWVAEARCLTRHGLKSWSDYVGRFGHDSWHSLRDTEQTRKFRAYFLAALTEADDEVYEEHKSSFLISWITCLVERESMLKFQHRLTSTLLNTDPNNPLLRNLPFYANKYTNRFEITPAELSQRRLSLISILLSNIREVVDDALYTSPNEAAKLKQHYKEVLKHLMFAMKQRYQELGHGSDVRGIYVDFVHRVVELLQQHTSTIYPVDHFFMDSATFPLPATDPTYVVGQLKHYGLRLQDSRTPKQLAVFLQSASERAVVDGLQEHLVGQQYDALANAFEYGDSQKPTLRAFVVKVIIPAYIEVAFSTASGWLLALPLLKALAKVFGGLLTDLDGTNPASLTAILATITVFLDCLRSPFNLLIDHSGLLDEPKVLKTLAVCYSVITATMPVLDYITRISRRSRHAVACIDFFKSFATFTLELLLGHSDVLSPEADDIKAIPPNHEYAEVRNFALHELRETVNKNWVCHNEQYQVVRGNSRKEVAVDIGSYAEEKEGLMSELDGFWECLGAMPTLNQGRAVEISARTLGISLDDVLLS